MTLKFKEVNPQGRYQAFLELKVIEEIFVNIMRGLWS